LAEPDPFCADEITGSVVVVDWIWLLPVAQVYAALVTLPSS